MACSLCLGYGFPCPECDPWPPFPDYEPCNAQGHMGCPQCEREPEPEDQSNAR